MSFAPFLRNLIYRLTANLLTLFTKRVQTEGFSARKLQFGGLKQKMRRVEVLLALYNAMD